MAFLSPTGHLPTENVDEEPFRFTRKLPLILTKLTPPRTPGILLQRDRLLTRLDNAACGSLTLVCAAVTCETTLFAAVASVAYDAAAEVDALAARSAAACAWIA